MENSVKWKLKSIRHSQVILDPFPEHTFYQSMQQSVTLFDRIVGKTTNKMLVEPEYISIHKAYRLGYEKAYEEIEACIGTRELK